MFDSGEIISSGEECEGAGLRRRIKEVTFVWVMGVGNWDTIPMECVECMECRVICHGEKSAGKPQITMGLPTSNQRAPHVQ